jgi:hypothetical protein
MAEVPHQNLSRSQGDAPRDSQTLESESLAPFQALACYLRCIDLVKKITAIAAVILGLMFVVAANRADYLHGTLRHESGPWDALALIAGIGFLACCAVAVAIVIEYLSRPKTPGRLFGVQLAVRFAAIAAAAACVFFVMHRSYGEMQAASAVTSLFLVLASVRAASRLRIRLAWIAAIFVGFTLYGTQTAFQFAVRHADEIATAGDRLRNCVPATPEGREISVNDSSVPAVLRQLGAKRIWIDDERVAVFVGPETEFQIFRDPHPDTTCNPQWGFRGKGATKISDRLWTNDY